MEYQDFHMHGGVVEDVQVNGDLHMHGGVVYRMHVYGNCIQHGGIIQHKTQNVRGALFEEKPSEVRIKYVDRVVYKDRIVYRDRYVDNPRTNDALDALRLENKRLREKLENIQPDDDVLVRRIETLENKLTEEREAHRKEVEELKWRLDAITDIANGRNERIYEDETEGHYIGVTDDSLDVLFTLINEYPIASDRDMSEEMGISVSTLRYIAKILRLAKSPEARRDARDRLKRHGIEMIERRGGDQTKGKRKKINKKQK